MSGGEAPLLRLICFDVLPSRVTACMTYLQLSDYRRTQQLHLALQVGFPVIPLQGSRLPLVSLEGLMWAWVELVFLR